MKQNKPGFTMPISTNRPKRASRRVNTGTNLRGMLISALVEKEQREGDLTKSEAFQSIMSKASIGRTQNRKEAFIRERMEEGSTRQQAEAAYRINKSENLKKKERRRIEAKKLMRRTRSAMDYASKTRTRRDISVAKKALLDAEKSFSLQEVVFEALKEATDRYVGSPTGPTCSYRWRGRKCLCEETR